LLICFERFQSIWFFTSLWICSRIYSVSFFTVLKYDILDCNIIIDNWLDRTLDFWLWRIPPCHIWRFAIDGWNMISVWISYQSFFKKNFKIWNLIECIRRYIIECQLTVTYVFWKITKGTGWNKNIPHLRLSRWGIAF
jgi:hypothetical protein